MKHLGVILVLFSLLAVPVLAQGSDEEMAKRYNISFPIQELGGCTSISSCKSYCEDLTNRQTCIEFAKKKGFYNETGMKEQTRSLVEDAKGELGCSSEDDCRSFCQKPENSQRCQNFAKQHGFGDKASPEKSSEMMQKAKEILGCDSAESCRRFCEQESNRERCMNFAKSVGVSGGGSDQMRREDGEGSQMRQNSGPGGCNSQETCEKYCQEHPNECGRGLQQGQQPPSGNQVSPSQTEDMMKAKEEYCRQYPERCREQQNYPTGQPQSGEMPTTSGDYCRQYPERCKQPEGATGGGTAQPGSFVQPSGTFQPYTVTPAGEQGPAPTLQQVQGITTRRSLWQRFVDFVWRFKGGGS